MENMSGLPDGGQSSCGQGSSGWPKVDLPLLRREFLKGSGVVLGSLTGSSLLALAPSSVWALELKNLSADEGKALMAMGRVLYPHRNLPDAVYALLAKDLDANKDDLRLLRGGVERLNKGAGGHFVGAGNAKKLEVVKSLEPTRFFNKVRSQCTTSLYDNDMAYAAFGLPGPSWDKKGCITRGFQDLKWLSAADVPSHPTPLRGAET